MIVLRYLLAFVIIIGSAFAVLAMVSDSSDKSVILIVTLIIVAGLMKLTLLRKRKPAPVSKDEEPGLPTNENNTEV